MKTAWIDELQRKGISDFPGTYEPDDERQYREYEENAPKVMEKILKDR